MLEQILNAARQQKLTADEKLKDQIHVNDMAQRTSNADSVEKDEFHLSEVLIKS